MIFIFNYILLIGCSVNAAFHFTHGKPMWGAADVAIALFNLVMLAKAR